MRYLVAFLLWLLPSLCSAGPGEVESVTFNSSVMPPVFSMPGSLKSSEALFRASLRVLPESMIVMSALRLSGQRLGVEASALEPLAAIIGKAYRTMAGDPAVKATPSALPYCFSDRAHLSGHYFLYRLHQHRRRSSRPQVQRFA